MAETRSGDLVLPQGTYVLVQDGASGQVEVISGPNKSSLADTDKLVIYERESRRFTQTNADRAIRVNPSADEGQYLVLTNPSEDKNGNSHPEKGKTNNVNLFMGKRINIQGPATFSLYPHQIADVIDGHQLKSNEYLLIRVYNEQEAKEKENLKNAVIKSVEGDEKKNLFVNKDIRTGNLLIIKGTDVSFYIPPTGIEVLEDNNTYTRAAVTLERLEYCILLDQNGDKRYVEGPSVVFPKPTETFVTNKGKRIFKAIELNENMALYIKVIADYKEKGLSGLIKGTKDKNFIAGEELFISGKDQKIYFPRPEHAIVKYGDEAIHYATAVPKGEGRYILDKTTGDVKLVKGPKMLLADPRSEVIVKRILNDKIIDLWFPGNNEAKDYNQTLRTSLQGDETMYLSNSMGSSSNRLSKTTVSSSDIAGSMHEELHRNSVYTKPRSIKLDTKYEGAVLINVWPNYAIQVVNKSGDRTVVEGPKVVMLAYDESLEVLALSSGKPKNDHDLIKTTYLQTKNNVVSDIITVETKDLINVDVRLSYKVNFEGDNTKWFGVSDYIKLLTQHMRSLIRNSVKKITIEDFNDNSTDIIRNTVLGISEKDEKRSGRNFNENGMKIYDIEVLNIKIGDREISEMLIDNQHNIVEQNLKIIHLSKDLEFTKKQQEFKRLEFDEKLKTDDKYTEVKIKEISNVSAISKLKEDIQSEAANLKLDTENVNQEIIDNIASAKLSRDKAVEDFRTSVTKDRTEIQLLAVEREMASIQPGLIEALISSGNVKLADSLAKNLKPQTAGLGGLLGGGGFKELLDTVKGSPLESRLISLIKSYDDLKTSKSK